MLATTNLSDFWEAWPLFEDAVIAGSCVGLTLGVLGVYIVLGRMVFLSAALSQVASFGVTLAYAAQIFLGVSASIASPTLGAWLISIACLVLVWRNSEMDRSRRDTMLGVMFLIGNAGTLLVASKITHELHDVRTLLFGSSVAVAPGDVKVVITFMIMTLLLHLSWWRGFVEITYDEDTAKARNIPVLFLKSVLLISVAIFISVATRVMGALPAFAFSVFPALTAIELSSNVPRALMVSGLVGAFCGFGGYLGAFVFDLPVGPSQAALGFFLWILVMLVVKGIRLAKFVRS